jgi:hypothetical protein
MSVLTRALYRGLILAWAGYTALAQPGIPACWMEASACEAHVHFNHHQAETPHSHDYLVDLASGQGVPGVAALLIPVNLLLDLIFGGLVLRAMLAPVLVIFVWNDHPEPPPPHAGVAAPSSL